MGAGEQRRTEEVTAPSGDAEEWLRRIAHATPLEPATLASAELVGETIEGKYRIEGFLGRGGMGAVFRATHLGTGREVALKVLAARLAANERAIDRFQREARAAGRIRHPNVVDVTDFGFARLRDERFAYLVMELLRGHTLRVLLEARGALPVPLAIDLLEQVAAGVAAAHEVGVLHRDLKPENIHVEPRPGGGYHAKVLDFGIAKLLEDPAEAQPIGGDAPTPPAGSFPSGITEPSAGVGTPLYMAPEQWLGRGTDARTDVYALGVIAYELLGGVPPFLGRRRPIAIEHTTARPPPLGSVAPRVSSAIVRVIERALAKDPRERPPSAERMAAALRAATESPGSIVLRSVSLCLGHYRLLFRRCLPMTLSALGLAAIGCASSLAARAGWMPRGADAAVGVAVLLLSDLAIRALAAPVSGSLVPVVEDLTAGRSITHGPPSRAEFWRIAWGAFLSTLVGVVIAGLAGVMARGMAIAVFGVRSKSYALELAVRGVAILLAALASTPLAVCAAVVAVEGLHGWAPIRRSVELVRPIWKTAFGVVFTCVLIFQSLGVTVLLAIMTVTRTGLEDLYPLGGRAFVTAMVWRVVALIYSLLFGAFVPATVSVMALLYLHARAAEVRLTGDGNEPSWSAPPAPNSASNPPARSRSWPRRP